MAGVGIREISKRFGDAEALKAVSLDVRSGEFLSLLGPSGCGKSTLLRIIAGLERQTAGGVSIGGAPVDGRPPAERDVAMVFQSYALYPYMTVRENMALPLKMRRLSSLQRLPVLGRMLPGSGAAFSQIDKDVRDVAASLEIAHLLDRKPGALSGGQRQRVAVGRALVRRPRVFLMDEPLSNLDAKLRMQLRAEIKDLHRRLGITFIYVTHDQAEAMTLSDRIAVMMHGRILQTGAPGEIYARPATTAVAAFVGSPPINLLHGVVADADHIDGPTGPIRLTNSLPVGQTVLLGVRAEHFRLSQGPGGAVTGQVDTIEDMGSDLFLHVAVDGQAQPVTARLDPMDGRSVSVGDIVHLRVDEAAAVLFGSDGRRVAAPKSSNTGALQAVG